TPSGAANDGGAAGQWGMRIIGAEAAWTVGLGANSTIAIVDSGVDPNHEDLRGKVLPGRNFVDPSKPPHDDNGHGTHVAGIAAALTDNGLGVTGVAPEASILPVKVLAANGTGTGRHVVDGIRWAAENGATVINVSLGAGYEIDNAYISTTATDLRTAVNYAWNKGAVVVVAAGNDPSAVNVFAEQPVIVVTATDDGDQKSPYATGVGISRWGLAAPGGTGKGPATRNILSTYWVAGASDRYAWAAGTSMAAPHVAGAAAILRERGLDKEQTVARLRGTAKDLGDPGRDNVYGDGRLDVARAVQGLRPAARTIRAAGPTNTPTTTRRGGSNGTTVTTTKPAAPAPPEGPLVGATPGLNVEPFDANGPAPGGTLDPVDDTEEAARKGGGEGGRQSDDERPWAPAALGAGLLAAAAAGIVRAGRA
ncbi:MAG TPA: S8 family serine peptidase, partial [Acidimicrobiales bacterium]|nr:S8 family serine peptidase [Acidimicrobiales bacterium]